MSDLDMLYKYLLSDNVEEYETEIFELIPELKKEKGFEQKSEWHCFDVWNHTLATIDYCDKNQDDRLVLLLHDIGKPFHYQDDGEIRHFKDHAAVSSKISKKVLERLNYPKDKMEFTLKLIEMHSTKIVVDSINKDDLLFYLKLVKIQICDAHGYEKKHTLMVMDQLKNTENKIKKLCNNMI